MDAVAMLKIAAEGDRALQLFDLNQINSRYGDHLARFLIRELEDTHLKTGTDQEQLVHALAVLDRAFSRLTQVQITFLEKLRERPRQNLAVRRTKRRTR